MFACNKPKFDLGDAESRRSPGCTTVNLTTTLPPLSFAPWSDTSGYTPTNHVQVRAAPQLFQQPQIFRDYRLSEVSQDRCVDSQPLPQYPQGRRELTLALCLSGHFIYECKGSRPYLSRPSRTQQLENPKVLAKLKADGKPSVEVPEEFKSKCVFV